MSPRRTVHSPCVVNSLWSRITFLTSVQNSRKVLCFFSISFTLVSPIILINFSLSSTCMTRTHIAWSAASSFPSTHHLSSSVHSFSLKYGLAHPSLLFILLSLCLVASGILCVRRVCDVSIRTSPFLCSITSFCHYLDASLLSFS